MIFSTEWIIFVKKICVEISLIILCLIFGVIFFLLLRKAAETGITLNGIQFDILYLKVKLRLHIIVNV